MIFLWIALGFSILFIIIAIVLYSIVLWAYRKAFYVSPNHKENIFDIPKEDQYNAQKSKMIELIKEMAALPYEKVSITSFDGLKLYARYYHISDDAPLQIEFHGYRGTAIRDFCGGNRLARKLGFNTLVVDQRAHGKSEGRTITFGIKERFDCIAWVEYAAKRFNCDIYLAGVSMGAATVLMASEFDLPGVKGIIADCPYSSPSAIIKKVCLDMGLPPKFSYRTVKIAAEMLGKFNLEEASASDAVKKAKVPILIIHGESDRFVPCEMSKELAEVSHAVLVTFPGAGHGLSYIEDPVRYEEITREFIACCKEYDKKTVIS